MFPKIFEVECSYYQFSMSDKSSEVELPVWEEGRFAFNKSGALVIVDGYDDVVRINISESEPTDLDVSESIELIFSFEMEVSSGQIEFASPDSIGMDELTTVLNTPVGNYRITVVQDYPTDFRVFINRI